MQTLATNVNSGKTYSGNYFLQTADIDCSSVENWTPIGDYSTSTSYYFSGTYDGGDFSISNLKIDTSSDYQGLFGAVTQASLLNINLQSSSIVTTGSYVGGLVGKVISSETANTLIQYCTISENTLISGESYVGGIGGYVLSCNVLHCSNSSNIVSSSEYCGGIAGRIVGSASPYSTVQYCFNVGQIEGSREVGGIVGTQAACSNIADCYNSGNVIGSSGVGGIIGRNYSGDSSNEYPNSLTNCYNKGSVTCSGGGGIIGTTSPTFYFIEIKNCYNVGTSNYGIMGDYMKMYGAPTFSNNYWDTDCGGTAAASISISGATGLSDLDTTTYALNASWSFYNNWDFNGVWIILDGVNDGYPVFRWTLKSCTVTFDANGGTGTIVEPVTGLQGSSITLPTSAGVTREGYYFYGWNLSAISKTTPDYAIGASFTIAEDVTLYANWRPLSANMIIKSYANGSVDSDVYNALTSGGWSADFTYYNTILSGNETQNVSKTITNNTTISVRTAQTISISNIVAPDGYICIGLNSSKASEVASATVNMGTSSITISLYFKKVSDNKLKYDSIDQYFYFEDGEFPQTAVVTYDEVFNALLTGKTPSSTFESNGNEFSIIDYTYSDLDDASFAAYDGQTFLGFEMQSTKIISLKNDTVAERTFSVGETYWFRFDAIRWRVSEYDIAETDLPSDWDTFSEGQTNFNAASDILWWSVLNDNTSNPLGAGDNALQTTLAQNISNGALFDKLNLEYSSENAEISVDKFNNSNTSNQKVVTENQEYTGKIRLASLEEISTYQKDLRCYASQLVAVLAGRDQTKFFEYWTRDFGQQTGCGTYVTNSDQVMKNTWMTKSKGVRFSITMIEGSSNIL